MKRFVGVMAGLGVLILLTGAALAFMGPGARPMGMGAGMMGMGPGVMGAGSHMMGGAAGTPGCPGMAAAGTATPPAPVTEEKAKELAQEYADKYLPGFTVEKVLPFTMGHGTGYSVELKGPKEEVRTFHINPWGNVMPFGGPGRRGA